MRFLPKLLGRVIRRGRLQLTGPEGDVYHFGQGSAETDASGLSQPDVAIRITEPKYDWKLVLNPELYCGEAYMDGHLLVEQGDIYDLLTLFFVNKRRFDLTAGQIYWKGVARKLRRLHQHNPVSRARANARHHYDIGNDLYRLFLDEDMQYSCGYFPNGDETLAEAQLAKKRHIAAKLVLGDGQRVLDIGCGWGGLALYLASVADVEVLGVTLSEKQLEIARARASASGLDGRVRFELRDYREIDGRFDRVVSVGMLEHIGVGHLDEYFRAVRGRLEADGVALIHSISSKSPPGVTGPFLQKYIFPGGYSPSLSEAMRAVEATLLFSLDIEIWRKHYGWTLRAWRERCAANRDAIVALYDDRFYRMWEFYLAACEGAFMYGSAHVFQLQLGRRRDAVPQSRDYIAAASAALKAREAEFVPRINAATRAVFGD